MGVLSAYRYFRRHGYRAAEAWALARAEHLAEEAGCLWDWLPDDEDCWDGDATPEERYGCVLRDSEGAYLASLWSIGDPDGHYVRYVQAELAREALDAGRL